MEISEATNLDKENIKVLEKLIMKIDPVMITASQLTANLKTMKDIGESVSLKEENLEKFLLIQVDYLALIHNLIEESKHPQALRKTIEMMLNLPVSR